jgi:hypothetical protein
MYIRYYFTDFIKGIKNLYRWFPIIWKDRDWDSYFIFEILISKLKNTAKYNDSINYHTNAKRDSQRMMTCVRLIERVQEDYYSMEWVNYETAKFEIVDSSGDSLYKIKKIISSENYNNYFAKYKLTHKKVLSGEIVKYGNHTDERIAMTIADYKHEQARRLLFAMIEKHIEGWWV